MTAVKQKYPYYAMCLDNDGHEPSLCVGKIYRIIKPKPNDGPHYVRVIDEEGEDYLYGATRFVLVDIPPLARKAVMRRL